MFKARKPRIGFLGIMHGLYDESQSEITRNQEAFAREVVKSLSGRTHHQVLTLGDESRKWTMWADILGLECVRI